MLLPGAQKVSRAARTWHGRVVTTTLAERIAQWACSMDYDDLPSAVVHEVKRRVLDSLGCAFGAWDAEPCVIARRVMGWESGSDTLVADRSNRDRSVEVTFALGCAVRYLDFNDTYLSKEPAHPSDNIAPALVVGEAEGASGREVIAAIALAYELQCRLCDTASLRARGWDHVSYVAFSSALAAARLMRLDVARTRHALNIAGVSAGSLRQSRAGVLSHWKGCTVAHAAQRGVFAAMLAREGMTGPEPIFEGVFGFEKLVSGSLQGLVLDPEAAMILQTSIKFWPAEYHSQSAIAAALRLRADVEFADIETVTIESHDASVDIIGSEPEKWRPVSRETADHSLPYIVAVALADGEITERQFATERFADPVLVEFLQRVTVERSAELTALYPRSVANIVTIRLRDGRVLSERVEDAPGAAKNPLSDAQVEAKFHALADGRIGREKAAALAAWVWELDGAEDLGALRNFLSP